MKIIAHGIDLVDFARIENMYSSHDQRFLDRVYTANEQAYALKTPNKTIERLAGRFAAKEAVLKLIGTGLRGTICWTDIEVVNNALGEPIVHLDGEVKKIVEQKSIEQITLSITHTADFAIASAVALKEV